MCLALVSPAAAEPSVEAAIVAAVRARVGPAADVQVEQLVFRVEGTADALVATPAPGARLGRPVRFSLVAAASPRRPVGDATATVRVIAPHVRANAPIARGTVLRDADLLMVTGDIGEAALEALPTVADAAGGRARRDLAAGEPITRRIVALVPLVESGRAVTVRAVVGDIEARVQAIARQSGSLGDRVQLVNPQSRRRLVGRVTGKDEVEVLNER